MGGKNSNGKKNKAKSLLEKIRPWHKGTKKGSASTSTGHSSEEPTKHHQEVELSSKDDVTEIVNTSNHPKLDHEEPETGNYSSCGLGNSSCCSQLPQPYYPSYPQLPQPLYPPCGPANSSYYPQPPQPYHSQNAAYSDQELNEAFNKATTYFSDDNPHGCNIM